MIPLVPLPAHCQPLPGVLTLNAASTTILASALQAEGAYLATELSRVLGAPLQPATSRTTAANICLTIDPTITHPEGYTLDVSPSHASLAGRTPAGVFYACQSLLQLAHAATRGHDQLNVPCVHIQDEPRFTWRGIHMDVSRHFFTADEVCRLIDLIAIHKFNRFHWHLTDDQGWRLPIAKYPRLTEIGGFRKATLIGHDKDRPRRYDDTRYGGFYTTADIRRVVAHAAARHITVVPEIDMPGHMQAAIAAYPELGCTTAALEPRCHWGISQHILNADASTIRFMQDVLEEVLDLFPSEFIHIGGDEAHKHEWSESRAVQNRMAELSLKGEDQLQSWFISQMESFLAQRGRRLIGWDEILEGGLPKGAAIMSWRGTKGGIEAASAGHDVVMTPSGHTYFDYYQQGPQGEPLAIGGMKTLEGVYGFEPIPAELAPEFHRRILGAQGQLWSEYIPTMAHLEYMGFPRACALAEVLWSPKNTRDWPAFTTRLESHQRMLQCYNVRYCPIAPRPTAV